MTTYTKYQATSVLFQLILDTFFIVVIFGVPSLEVRRDCDTLNENSNKRELVEHTSSLEIDNLQPI